MSKLGKDLRVYTTSLLSPHVHGSLKASLVKDDCVLSWMDLKDTLVADQVFKGLPMQMIREVRTILSWRLVYSF